MKPLKLTRTITDVHEMLDFIRDISRWYCSIYGSDSLFRSLMLDYTYDIWEDEDHEYIAIDIVSLNIRVAEYKRCRWC
jgi:hypothetical protein